VPIYSIKHEILLATPRTDTETIARLRRKLNNSNLARAAISTAGVLLLGLSLIV
jgi:hypothetical protein